VRNDGVGSWTARRARKTPGQVAIVHDGAEISYSELHARVTRLAASLRSMGIGRGDRVAYLGPNHPAFCIVMFATWAVGGVFVPLNARLAAPEIAQQVADAGAVVLFCAAERAETGRDAEVAGAVRTVVPAGWAAGVPGDREAGPSYESLIAAGPDEWTDEPVRLDDPCLIMYTSGTTGRAKGATLTHGNITWNAFNVLVDTDLRGDDVALVVAPLFHTAALNMLSLPVLLKGGTLVIEGAFDPARALSLIERHRVSVIFGVPAMYDAIAASDRWQSADLSSLRTLLCGGAPVPLPTIECYLRRGLSFIQGYGMTEASPGVLLLDAGHAETKAGSAGVPHFFTDVRIVELADRGLPGVGSPGVGGLPGGGGLPGVGSPGGLPGVEAAAGERGEILVAGPNVMRGYWNLPDATAAALPDGWLRSGDVATADADGYVFVTDRLKDVIISGGENIYPAEVENALRAHPAVADCGVIGVPDQRWGEVGRAVVVLRPGATAGERDLLDFLDGRIARYKIPKSVSFVAELPRTATGKIAKKILREAASP
jgi:acyl-CoA synthetase (AMP-forming)/AMP-acid ligase II